MDATFESDFSPLKRLAVTALAAVVWAVGLVFFVCPFPLKRSLAQILTFAWFWFVPFRKTIVLHNLCHVFARESQESMGEYRARIEALARRNFVNTWLALFELFERGHWTRATFEQRVTVRGRGPTQQLENQKKGYFFLTAHIGNWELITFCGVQMGIPLAIITKALHNGLWDAVWVRSRRRYGLELLAEKGSSFSIVKAVKEGKAVGFILDQHIGAPMGVESQFMGRLSMSPRGLAVLADRMRAPIMPAHLIRTDRGRYVLEMGAAIDIRLSDGAPHRDSKGQLTEAGVREHVEQCNRIIEGWVKAHPDQYLWLHKRFKNHFDYHQKLLWQL